MYACGHVGGACVFTSDFSDSGVLAALIIALLFFWQTQHGGFITDMCGVSCLHSEQKVVYAASLMQLCVIASKFVVDPVRLQCTCKVH